MKISKTVWIDEHVKWHPLKKRTLVKKHRYQGNAYFVCTSPQAHWLFEIVEARWLSDYYHQETVVAICSTRAVAFERVRQLIDGLYNTKTLSYEKLIE